METETTIVTQTLFEELMKAANTTKGMQPPLAGEHEQDFIRRLMRAISNIDNKLWDTLSDEAQQWYNDNAVKAEDGSVFNSVPGYIPGAKPAVVRVPKPRPAIGIMADIKTMVILDPSLTIEQVKAGLVTKGYLEDKIKESTLYDTYTNTQSFVRLAKDLSKWREEVSEQTI